MECVMFDLDTRLRCCGIKVSVRWSEQRMEQR